MKQPCCPGMNNSRGAHIHLSTRQIWGPGREMRPRKVRPRGQGRASKARVEGVVVVVVSCWGPLFDLGPVDGPLAFWLGPKA